MDRRTFVKTGLAGSLPLMMANPLAGAVRTDMEVLIFATQWGIPGSPEEFCARAKAAGYDGVEAVWIPEEGPRKAFLDALQRHELQVGWLIGSWDSDPEAHRTTFLKNLAGASSSSSQTPVYLNCHSGKDHYSFAFNQTLIQATKEAEAKSGIPVYHETHRGRMCFAAPVTRTFLEANPEMRLTLDISHWVNVHESMLEDQPENVELALSRTGHIHARIGHQEGPQVSDPRAPEWADAVARHVGWWDRVVEHRQKAGQKRITFLTEFGPPNYLPALPYTRQPVADLWEINVHMKNLLHQRYRG